MVLKEKIFFDFFIGQMTHETIVGTFLLWDGFYTFYNDNETINKNVLLTYVHICPTF